MPEIFRDLTKREDSEPARSIIKNYDNMFNIFIYDVLQQEYRIMHNNIRVAHETIENKNIIEIISVWRRRILFKNARPSPCVPLAARHIALKIEL